MGWECPRETQVRGARVKSNWTEMDMANIRMERGEVQWEQNVVLKAEEKTREVQDWRVLKEEQVCQFTGPKFYDIVTLNINYTCPYFLLLA